MELRMSIQSRPDISHKDQMENSCRVHQTALQFGKAVPEKQRREEIRVAHCVPARQNPPENPAL
jgi:hypothetical protein